MQLLCLPLVGSCLCFPALLLCRALGHLSYCSWCSTAWERFLACIKERGTSGEWFIPLLFGQVEAINHYFLSSVDRRMYHGTCDLDNPLRIILYPTGLQRTGSVFVVLELVWILPECLCAILHHSAFGSGEALSALQ